MRRLLAPILLLALGCDKEPAKTGPADGGTAQRPPKPPPVLPTTGGPEISKFRRDLLEDIERMETQLDEGKVPEQRFVEAARKKLENLLLVTGMAVDREAEDLARRELALLREKQGAIDRKRNDLYAGILEIEQLLAQERPPAGFTEDELKDRLGERREEARALEKEEQELLKRMKEKEDLLNSGEKVPPQGRSLHTQEREAAQELKTRLEALEARLKGK